MIHLQPYYGRPTVCGDALDFEGALFSPLKMVCPRLRPWVEQCHGLPRHGIVPVDVGVPGVLEQKTSILCNILDLLIYIGHILIVSTLVMQTAEDGDENLFHGLNSTLIIEKIKCFGPRWTWIKTIVFLHNFDPSRTDRRFLYVCYGNPQCADNPTIPPGAILPRPAHHEGHQFLINRGTPWGLALLGAIKLRSIYRSL
jgi:hypothetical protein